MQKRLAIENCIDMYCFAKHICCTELQNEAFALVCKKFLEVSHTNKFLELSKEDFIDFLSSDDLSVSFVKVSRFFSYFHEDAKVF